MPERTDYIKPNISKMRFNKNSSKGIELLWGDKVTVLNEAAGGGYAHIKARGIKGFVKKEDLGGEALLEIYFCDVGQGDGTIIVTPERKHIVIDGGWPRGDQPTGKNAADFIDWKFAKDYGMDQIEIDALVCSHNDQDHYGGLWDLLNPEEEDELNVPTKDVRVEKFYHAGLSWWTKPGQNRTLGETVTTPDGKMFTELLSNRQSILDNLDKNQPVHLQGDWAKFLGCVSKAKKKNGRPTTVKRLSHKDQYLPGFDGSQSSITVKMLAPVEFSHNAKPAIRYYSGGTSKNTNGNSLLMRVDYGSTRILLTGDLNTKSMNALMKDWSGHLLEFQCDVAKACHHGSDDVSYKFLSALNPSVTVISSGDCEGHDHPRPSIVAASATTGYLQIDGDKLISPLVYSTELARSYKLSDVKKIDIPPARNDAALSLKGSRLDRSTATLKGNKRKKFSDAKMVSGVVYGLVNVRTNGSKIICATMNEKDHGWEVKEIQSRF